MHNQYNIIYCRHSSRLKEKTISVIDKIARNRHSQYCARYDLCTNVCDDAQGARARFLIDSPPAPQHQESISSVVTTIRSLYHRRTGSSSPRLSSRRLPIVSALRPVAYGRATRDRASRRTRRRWHAESFARDAMRKVMPSTSRRIERGGRSWRWISQPARAWYS